MTRYSHCMSFCSKDTSFYTTRNFKFTKHISDKINVSWGSVVLEPKFGCWNEVAATHPLCCGKLQATIFSASRIPFWCLFKLEYWDALYLEILPPLFRRFVRKREPCVQFILPNCNSSCTGNNQVGIKLHVFQDGEQKHRSTKIGWINVSSSCALCICSRRHYIHTQEKNNFK